MVLRTDYTDAVWSGNRKFEMTDNGDGTVSFEDKTTYTKKENSFFGADDANTINAAINTLNDVKIIAFVKPTSSKLGYVKFANGLTFIFGRISKSLAITTAWGNMYSSNSATTISYPITLTTIYTSSVQFNNPNAWIVVNSANESDVSFYGVSGASKTYTSYVSVFVVGVSSIVA